MELIIIFVIVVILAIWIGAALAAFVFLLPIFILMAMGLNWWQSLLAAVFILALANGAAEYRYARHFKKHRAEFGLPADFIGRQIEIEGKLVKILGTAGTKVMISNKDSLFGRKIDMHLARTKAGL